MKTLTIVGRGPSWIECPFCTDELWGNATCLLVDGLKDKKYTKVFVFDGLDDPEIKESVAIARERNIPLLGNKDFTEPYPIREVIQHFKTNYLKNTMSYMLALSIYEGYDKIWIDGIDAGPNWLYQSGKPWVIFWLGVMTGRGIDYRIGQHSLGWAYRLDIDGIPEAFLTNEGVTIVHSESLVGGKT